LVDVSDELYSRGVQRESGSDRWTILDKRPELEVSRPISAKEDAQKGHLESAERRGDIEPEDFYLDEVPCVWPERIRPTLGLPNFAVPAQSFTSARFL